MNQKNTQSMVYVGTYTNQGSEGIYGYHLDTESGRMDPIGVLAQAENPSYLAFDQKKQYLYAVYETERYQDRVGGAVGSYAVDSTNGKLKAMNEQLTQGMAPCHLFVSEEKHVIVTANYTDGSLSVFPLNSDGSIGAMSDYIQHKGFGPNQERQEKAHAHYVTFTPDGNYLCAVDLGIDQIKMYQVDASNHSLSEVIELTISIKAGSGPRHIAFHPNYNVLYVVNELSSEVMVYQMAWDGKTSLFQTITTLPDNFVGESICAAIKITPDGRFLYVSNRGEDSLAGFHIDPSGKLELISHTSSGGSWPRDLEIDPDGQWILVANQESDNITAFQIQADTGLLTPMGTVVEVSKPVCVKIIN